MIRGTLHKLSKANYSKRNGIIFIISLLFFIPSLGLSQQINPIEAKAKAIEYMDTILSDYPDLYDRSKSVSVSVGFLLAIKRV